MKPTVLFIVPPKTRRPMSGYISPLVDASVPLGILQMASFLEKNNYTVKLIDNLGDKESVSHKSNKEEIMYGIPKARLKQRIKESNANIVVSRYVSSCIKTKWDCIVSRCLSHINNPTRTNSTGSVPH